MTSPAAHAEVERQVEQHAAQQGRRRSVADAHFTRKKRIVTGIRILLSQGDAGGDTRLGLGGRHRCLVKGVARAQAELARDQVGGGRKLGGDTGVDHLQVEPVLAREGVDGRPAAQEVVDHLHGYFLRTRADFFVGQTVVTGEHQDEALSQRGAERGLHEPKPVGELL